MRSMQALVRELFPCVVLVGCATANSPSVPIPLEPDVPEWIETGALVQVGDLAFAVPAEGETVVGEGVRLDGTMVLAGITRDDDGFVTAIFDERPATDGLVTYACTNPTECADTARNPWKGKWRSTYAWRFNQASMPAGYDPLVVRDDITKSADNWRTGRNSCGMADEAGGPDHAFDRTTTTKPNITAAGTCNKRDSESVIGFGPLDSYLGYACVWWSGWPFYGMQEADIVIDNAVTFFTGPTVPSGCSGRYGLRQLMTHEFGHAFGFGHVEECGHAEATMSPNMSSCSNSNETLGRGDVLGLNDKY